MKILLIEDDEILIAVLTKSLIEHHYIVDVVKDGEMGWTYSTTFEYDLIVLDIGLPKLDRIKFCQRFRAEGYTTPIMVLSAQNDSMAKVSGLDAGADDYVVKPFNFPELFARIRALLRRSNDSSSPLLMWADLLLNPSTCEVSYNNHPLTLTNKEYELLELLLRDSQHLLSSDEILDRLWSSDEFPSEATVRSHIRRLRHKLVTAGAPSDFIATVHGRGYYLKAPNAIAPHHKPTKATSTPILPSAFTSDRSQIGIKIMVVDGDLDFLRSLSKLLKPWEFQLNTLADPLEFWAVLEALQPDLLLLEVNIPNMDGIQLCRGLRSNPNWQRLPVFFLSSVTDTDSQNLAFSVGADDYLCKPIAGVDLANRIHNRLQRIKAYSN